MFPEDLAVMSFPSADLSRPFPRHASTSRHRIYSVPLPRRVLLSHTTPRKDNRLLGYPAAAVRLHLELWDVESVG